MEVIADLHKELCISKLSKHCSIKKDGETALKYGVASGAKSLQDGTTFGVDLFECKSKKDLAEMIKLNIKPEKILFSAPCKMQSHIKYAGQNNVKLFTFDNALEMKKIKSIVPDAKLLLSVEVNSTQEMGFKFGANEKEVDNLLQEAKENQINVVGAYLHNNSCWLQEDIACVKQALDVGDKIGLKMGQLHLNIDESDNEKLGDIQKILGKDIKIFAKQAVCRAKSSKLMAETCIDEKSLPAPLTTYCKLEAPHNNPVIPRLAAPLA